MDKMDSSGWNFLSYDQFSTIIYCIYKFTGYCKITMLVLCDKSNVNKV